MPGSVSSASFKEYGFDCGDGGAGAQGRGAYYIPDFATEFHRVPIMHVQISKHSEHTTGEFPIRHKYVM